MHADPRTPRSLIHRQRSGGARQPNGLIPWLQGSAPRLSALLVALLVAAAAGCGGDKVVPQNLFLEVSSDAPAGGAKLQSLRILFSQTLGDGSVKRYPLTADSIDFNPALGTLDPVAAPVLLSLKYDGTTFGAGTNVVLQVTGRIGASPVTQFEGTVDLASEQILKVRLLALPANCDADGDGFLDCATAGCCTADTAFGDCEPTSAAANPWGVEPACEPCSDTVDQDCKGGDQACVDADSDGIADCSETTCGLDDPKVGPGLPEVCDGKDNDCNSQTDEGLTLNYDGQTLGKGASCGRGKCAGGLVECDASGGLRCSTESQRAESETCGNAIDDDCNGTTDEGCQLGDFDGDGVALPADCNDFDAGIFPGRAGEPCCPKSAQGNAAAEAACDVDCSGQVTFCDAGDLDGDGVTVNEGDCDDTDPMVAPGKPERCGDGIDQDCFGGDLACTGLVDADGDGWPATVDCDDGDDAVRPGATELCNGKDDDCDQLVDEGDPQGGGRCGTTDVGECEYGLEHCKNSGDDAGKVLCVGNVEALAAELCNGKDDDCDGSTDETFLYGGIAIGQACDGVGACGAGVVECAQARTDKATCSTDADGSASQATTEICDGLDNDCDGETNENLTNVEDSTCLNAGVCATNRDKIVASCTLAGLWTCDYAAVTGYEANSEKSCDGKDNDCDGGTDEDLTFTQPDGAVRNFGGGCDGPDEDLCPSGIVRCAAGDITKTYCDETGNRVEVCDGLDNDCDGKTDEDFKTGGDNLVTLSGAAFPADNGKFLGDACGTGVCGVGQVVCNPGNRATMICQTAQDPSAETCDDADNDCDGQTDEEFGVSGTVKLANALYASDNGRYKGQTCGTGGCSSGVVRCKAGSPMQLECSSNGSAIGETCNGADDDCDGGTDEDYLRASGNRALANALFSTDNGKFKGESCGTGACASGSIVCSAADPTVLVCSSNGSASTDVCDGADNNCNGNTDEDYGQNGTVKVASALFSTDNGKYKGQACGTGACAAGTVVCGAGGTTLACSTNASATTDVCDGADNNCNGNTDEDYGATGTVKVTGALFSTDNGKYKGQGCGTGACASGTVVCGAGGTTLSCSTNGSATTDTCDGADNNCNGNTDEDYGASGTVKVTGALASVDNGKYKGQSCGVGPCAAGTVVCGANGTTLACSTNGTAATDVCDAIDNNCNGSTDEDFGASGTVKVTGALFASDNGKYKGQACGTGACATGTVVCGENKTTLACSTNASATVDLCDAADNDCDGGTDEDYLPGGAVKLASALFASDNGKGKGEACGTGSCVGGTVACTADKAALVCTTNLSASTDLCDNLDNNCNGTTDEEYGVSGTVKVASALFSSDNGKYKGQACGTGSCSGGSVVCATSTTLACSSNGSATPDTCDNVDNNCNGTTDDDYGATGTVKVAGALFSSDNGKYKGQSCGTGTCAGGTVACATTSTIACTSNNLSARDVCDNIDNNCNG
ncbi:MAG: putative metal-binding motif-containing protein, partial [Deltaproteobacteria bacterium]|nr:putative metal-binding motif-containing protein [Deltaproteobacteria bacterium]